MRDRTATREIIDAGERQMRRLSESTGGRVSARDGYVVPGAADRP